MSYGIDIMIRKMTDLEYMDWADTKSPEELRDYLYKVDKGVFKANTLWHYIIEDYTFGNDKKIDRTSIIFDTQIQTLMNYCLGQLLLKYSDGRVKDFIEEAYECFYADYHYSYHDEYREGQPNAIYFEDVKEHIHYDSSKDPLCNPLAKLLSKMD